MKQPPPKHRPVKVRVPTLSVVRQPAADLDVSAMRLGGKQLTARLRDAITDGTLEQTIEGASTLTVTVADWHEGLLHSQVIKAAAVLTFNGLSFTLTKLGRQGTAMQLTFEETAVNLLRQYKKPKTANRDAVTRAQFVRSLVAEVTQARIPFRCPEVNVRQPIGKSSSPPVRGFF